MPEKPEQCHFPQCKVRFALNKQLVPGGASKKPAKSLHLPCEAGEIIAPISQGEKLRLNRLRQLVKVKSQKWVWLESPLLSV